MKNKQLTAKLLFIALGVFISLSSLAGESRTRMVEVIELKDGKTSADVKGYFNKIGPIVSRYGAHNLHKISIPANEKSGNEKVVLVWKIDDMSKLPEVFKDEEYAKHIPLRDSVFKLPERQMFIGSKIK